MSVGISSGPAADKLMTMTKEMLADYIKEKSGTAASDQERKFIDDIIPKISVDRELFENRIKGAMEAIDRNLERSKIKARGETAAPAAPIPPATLKLKKSFPPGQEVRKDGQVYVVGSDGITATLK